MMSRHSDNKFVGRRRISSRMWPDVLFISVCGSWVEADVTSVVWISPDNLRVQRRA